MNTKTFFKALEAAANLIIITTTSLELGKRIKNWFATTPEGDVLTTTEDTEENEGSDS